VAVAPAARAMTTTVVDPLSLSITLAKPNPQLDRSIATTALTFIGSPKALQEKGAAFSKDPVGAGAFKLQEWVPGTSMTLARGEPYSGPAPLWATVKRVFGADDRRRYATMPWGAADLRVPLAPTVAAKGAKEGYARVDYVPNGGTVVPFNVPAAPFNDVRAR